MPEKTLKEKTANGLLWGGISNGVQQVLNLVFGIFLARLLSPADYGLVGMLTVFTALATVLQESGFISGLNRKENVRAEDYNAVFWFNIFCSITLYTILFFCAPLIAAWFRQPLLVPLARLSFLGFVISALNISPRAWLFRNMRVKQTAVLSIIALVLSGIIGVCLAWKGFAYWGIVWQNLIFCSVITVGSWYLCGWHPTLQIRFSPLRGMIKFSSRLLATNIFLNINNNLFSLFLGRLYGEREVGFYNQANKWSQMGGTLLSGMMWNVTQPLFARLSYDADPLREQKVFRKMLRFTSLFSFPCLFGLAIIAPEFITIAITAKWLPSAHLMQILCLGAAFAPLSSLCANFVISQGKSGVYMWNTVALCLVQILLLILLYPWGIRTMVCAYVIANILWLFVWQHFLHRLTGLRLLDALRDVVPFAALSAVAMSVAVLTALPFAEQIYASLAIKILVAATFYVALLKVFGAKIFAECLQFMKEKMQRKA